MYEGGRGAGAASTLGVGGAVLLPNTGGNSVLQVVAVASIFVGAAIVLSTVARLVAKKAYHKA